MIFFLDYIFEEMNQNSSGFGDDDRCGCEQKVISMLSDIMDRLDRIEDRLSRLEGSGQKMDSHIDFVEGIYSMVRRPFHGVMSFIDQSRLIMGSGGDDRDKDVISM